MPGIACPNIKTARRSFCFTELGTIVVVSRVMGRLFLRQGYRILLPDSRAHGESGGSVATYGLREGDDIHRWVDWLYGKGATCVNGFGESMGAALVLESLRSESRFCAIVAESAFSDFRSVAYDREGYFVGAGHFGLERIVGRTVGLLPAELGLLYARWRYGITATGKPCGCSEVLGGSRTVNPRRG